MRIKVPFFYRLTGFFTVLPQEGEKEKFLNLLLEMKIPALAEENGGYRVPLRFRKKLTNGAEKHKVRLQIGKPEGLPGFFFRYRMRVGVVAGLFLFSVMLVVGTNIVWRVEVEGTDAVGALQIRDGLAEIGFGVGSYIPAQNFTALAGRYRATHPEIAWMSVYCTGTVARVRVITAEKTEETQIPSVANLVAAEDGVITGIHVSHGTPCVRPGQVVKKGDLLISGIVSGANADTLLCAEGTVLAALEKEIVIDVPLKQTKTVATPAFTRNIGLNFFGKNINISLNTGKTDTTYGTIERESFLSLPGGIRLPVSFVRTDGVLYREEQVNLTEDEAVHLAYEKLKTTLAATLDGGTVLTKSVTVQTDGVTCILTCRLRYETDIARLSAVEVN